ncbi:MAG: DUF4838 domain-containing protein [Planctomycetota bacterium]|nr:DUF4838 domain-containing protein [Planctomycetota bacterium]
MNPRPLLCPMCAVILALLSGISCTRKIPINEGSDVSIVLSGDANETERFAADELRRYVKAMTGFSVPIVAGETKPEGFLILIGGKRGPETHHNVRREKQGPRSDRFLIGQKGSVLTLSGDTDRGTLYSVYEFLEQQGCRWFMPGKLGEYIPQRTALKIQAGNQVHLPDFDQREIDGSAGVTEIEEVVDWAVKNRLNRIFGIRDYHLRALPKDKRNAWRKRGGYLNWQWICHNFHWMISAKNYFKDHPDYFALYNGERVPLGSAKRPSYGGGNLCTTHPDVIRLCAEFAINWFDQNPDGMFVPLNPNDGAVKWCECSNCARLGGKNFTPGPEGSMTRRMVTFANEVARLVKAEHPNRKLLVLAYSNYVEPVPGLKLETNVVVQYCFHGCYAHSLDGCRHNREALRQFESWNRLTHQPMAVWEYFMIGDHASSSGGSAYLPLIYRARDTVRYFKQGGARYYFTQSSGKYRRNNALLYYVLARLLWNTDQDADALIHDFCQKMYGPAAGHVEKIVRLIENSVQKAEWHPRIYSDVAAPSPRVFRPEIMADVKRLLVRAEGLQLDRLSSERLALLRESIEFTKTNIGAMELSGIDADASWRIERKKDHYLINADGEPISPGRLTEIVQNATDAGLYNSSFERIIFRARKRREPIVFLENKRLKLAVLPGVGGRILRLTDKRTGRNFFKEAAWVNSLDSIGQQYFNYGGYEEYIGKAFASPGWEVPFSHTAQDDGETRRIVLSAQTGGFSLVRTVELDRGDSATVGVRSVLTNRTETPKRIMLRVHPMMTAGTNTGRHSVYLRKPDGSFLKSIISREFESLSIQPEGMWAVVNKKEDAGIVNIFEPSQASCYLFYDPRHEFFNMELMGTRQTIAPGDSLKIVHQYVVLDKASVQLKELEKQVPASTLSRPESNGENAAANRETRKNLKGAASIRPIRGTVDFEIGKVGKCARFKEQSLLSYSSDHIRGDAGTVETWFKLSTDAKEMVQEFLFGVGANNPDWFCVSMAGGRLHFLYKNGRGPYRKPGEFYASLSAPIDGVLKDEWRHLAVTWENLGKGKSVIQIYLDGKLKEKRANVTIGHRFQSDSVHIGYSGRQRNAFTGRLDEMRISDRARSPSEIEDTFRKGIGGTPVERDDSTSLLLRFDATTASAGNDTGGTDAERHPRQE